MYKENAESENNFERKGIFKIMMTHNWVFLMNIIN